MGFTLHVPLTRICRPPETVLFLLLFFVLTAVAAAAQGDYIGSKACKECHGAVGMGWQGTKHARAFADIEKTGQEKLPACVSCHVTGYGQPGGFVDKEITPHLSAVQCEACHGPGRSHAASHNSGAIVPAPGVDVCRRCHTPKQDPGFDYPAKVRGVHQALSGRPIPGKASPLAARPDHFSFGNVKEGTPATTTVVVRNMGDRAVRITGPSEQIEHAPKVCLVSTH